MRKYLSLSLTLILLSGTIMTPVVNAEENEFGILEVNQEPEVELPEMDSKIEENPSVLNGLSMEKGVLTIAQNTSQKINLIFTPEDAATEEILWISSDESVLTVDAEGVITGQMPGEAIVTAKAGDFEVTCSVTVLSKEWIWNGIGWWYKRADGSYPYGGWDKIDGKWYYFDHLGYRLTGWRMVKGKWYYMDPRTGAMYENQWLNDTYYLTETGAMAQGWLLLDDSWYYMSASGEKQTGWIKVKEKWYYLEPESGRMYESQWLDDVYYLTETGAMAQGWLLLDDEWYYMSASGEKQTGWIKVKEKWYYLEPETGRMYESQWLDDVYYLTETGAMAQGWLKLDNEWYYFNYSGEMQTGWVKVGYYWYYLYEQDNSYGKKCGVMAYSCTIDGYEIDKHGRWIHRIYQNPMPYYQIQDSISLSGGDYTLSYGFEGIKVMQVIRRLGLGSGIGMGGAFYGSNVQNAVANFQRNVGLNATGNVDLLTWVALGFTAQQWQHWGAYVTPLKVDWSSTREDHIEAMISTAYSYLGDPYVIGASGPTGVGIDCSGLVMQALFSAGIDTSPINPVRHAHPGYEYESRNMWASSQFLKVPYEQRQRGDLIFYQSSSGVVIHVAIYLGNDQVIESWPNEVVVWPIKHWSRSNIKGVVRPFI